MISIGTSTQVFIWLCTRSPAQGSVSKSMLKEQYSVSVLEYRARAG